MERSSFLAKAAKMRFRCCLGDAAATMAVGVAYLYHRVGIAAIALFGIVLFTSSTCSGSSSSPSSAPRSSSARQAAHDQARSSQRSRWDAVGAAAHARPAGSHDGSPLRGGGALRRRSRIAAGFSKEEQDLVHTAGLLHDLGKFVFPDRILKGDSQLTDEDWNIIHMHPYQGARVVSQMEGYGPISEIILAHHERIDGKGYPRRLKGPRSRRSRG